MYPVVWMHQRYSTCEYYKNAVVSKIVRETVPNRTSGKIKLTPPAYNHTTVLLVSSLNFDLLAEADCSRGEFTMMRKARMVVSSTGKFLG